MEIVYRGQKNFCSWIRRIFNRLPLIFIRAAVCCFFFFLYNTNGDFTDFNHYADPNRTWGQSKQKKNQKVRNSK